MCEWRMWIILGSATNGSVWWWWFVFGINGLRIHQTVDFEYDYILHCLPNVCCTTEHWSSSMNHVNHTIFSARNIFMNPATLRTYACVTILSELLYIIMFSVRQLGTAASVWWLSARNMKPRDSAGFSWVSCPPSSCIPDVQWTNCKPASELILLWQLR